jgi:FkbM family methyltransferase
VPEGFTVNFLGVKTKLSFGFTSPDRFVTNDYPSLGEDYFEWISLLESVAGAREEFIMFELGAGYGKWLVNAAAALNLSSKLPYRLVGVEPDSTHFRWMIEHARNNNVDLNCCRFFKAAVSNKSGQAWFIVGNAEWYGQAVYVSPSEPVRKLYGFAGTLIGNVLRRKGLTRVATITLDQLLESFRRVDLVDADLQFSEDRVFESSSLLNEKVARVHIGTHTRPIEQRLRRLFGQLGWEKLMDYLCKSETATPYGRVKFLDGIQVWANPRLTTGRVIQRSQ